MTPTQLKALGHLPAVMDALRALAEEGDEVRALMARIGGTPAQNAHIPQNARGSVNSAHSADSAAALIHPPVAPGHAALMTPERQEYEAAIRTGATIGLPEEAMSPGQRVRLERARFLAQQQNGEARAVKLQQFRHDGSPSLEAVEAENG